MEKRDNKNLESITARSVKCVWKSCSRDEARIFSKNNIIRPERHCGYCKGYRKDCPDYIQRIISYIKIKYV